VQYVVRKFCFAVKILKHINIHLITVYLVIRNKLFKFKKMFL